MSSTRWTVGRGCTIQKCGCFPGLGSSSRMADGEQLVGHGAGPAPSGGGSMPQLVDARRTRVSLSVLAAVTVAVAGPVPAFSAEPAHGGRAPAMTVLPPATGLAARTVRPPVAGGVYDPAARTSFISWAGVHEDNYVQAYDHRRGTWSAPVKVGDG